MTNPPSYTLVTGASSGIGRAIAITLAATQRLILHGRDLDRLAATQAQCPRADEHLLWRCDLTAVETIESGLLGLMHEQSLVIDRFVHSAGMTSLLPVKSLSIKSTSDILNVNLVSAMELTRVLTRKKYNHDSLRAIVFLSSIASAFGVRGSSVYCASKGALDAFMRALAVELAPATRVNSVLPGGVITPMTAHLFAEPGIQQAHQRDYPLGMGTPEDIADAVEFLLSEKARWITGQQLIVDGGRTVDMSAKDAHAKEPGGSACR